MLFSFDGFDCSAFADPDLKCLKLSGTKKQRPESHKLHMKSSEPDRV